MKTITFQANILASKLAMINGIVPQKPAMPILADFRLETVDDGCGGAYLSAVASDEECHARVIIKEATASETGILICVNAKDLLQVMKTLGDKVVTMEIDEESHMIDCKYDKGHFAMPYSDANEYPMPKDDIDVKMATVLDANNLLYAIGKVQYAMGTDDLRPVMSGIHLDFTDHGLVFVATNSKVLAKLTIKDNKTDTSNGVTPNFTIPKKIVSVLPNLFDSRSGDVTIKFAENACDISTDDVHLRGRLIEGRYPNYDAVIPKNVPSHANINKASWLAAMKRVSPMASISTEMIKLSFDVMLKEMNIQTEDIDLSKRANERIECADVTSEITMGFKSSILSQALGSIDTDNVLFEYSEPSRAALLKEENPADDSTDYVSLVMPMRIDTI